MNAALRKYCGDQVCGLPVSKVPDFLCDDMVQNSDLEYSYVDPEGEFAGLVHANKDGKFR